MIKIILLIVAVFVLEIKNIFLSTDQNNYLEKHLCYISSKSMKCLKNNKCSDNYKCKSGYFRCGLKYCAINKLSCRLFLFNEHNRSIINLNLIPYCSIDLTTTASTTRSDSSISLTDIDLKDNLCVINSKTNCFLSSQCYNNDYKCKKGYFKCGQNHCAKHKITCRLFLMNKHLTFKLKQQISTCLIIDSYIFSDESIIISINPKYYLFIFIFILFLVLYFADLSTNF